MPGSPGDHPHGGTWGLQQPPCPKRGQTSEDACGKLLVTFKTDKLQKKYLMCFGTIVGQQNSDVFCPAPERPVP